MYIGTHMPIIRLNAYFEIFVRSRRTASSY